MSTATPSDRWDSGELQRAAALAKLARARIASASPLWAVRAPGRVNLIGEHTDYSGLPVLPIAIDRSTIVLAGTRERDSAGAEIELHNVVPSYPPRHFALARTIAPFPTGDWGNYVKAAVAGVIDRFAASDASLARLHGGVFVVDGRVPPAAGLSSSAALTVASTLGFMALNGLRLAPIETAAMVARSEWYVGTMAGGMDQAASIMGRRGHALFIQFNPLRVRPVRMPPSASLVVADSLEVADKSGVVRAEYNRRVIECALAARILASALKLDGVKILGDVVRRLEVWDPDELVDGLTSIPPTDSLDQVARILAVEPAALAGELFGDRPDRVVPVPARKFEILRRARHVLNETRRVERAVVAFEKESLEEVGALMNASHQSLADDFEVSTPRLDRMVECARRGGALGARLTGAGFGGSIVALCRPSEVAGVIEELDRGYYERLGVSVARREVSRAVLHAGPGADTIELSPA